MAKRIAQFEKVSFAQFEAAWKDTFDESSTEKIQKIYDGIELPKRATSGSAGMISMHRLILLLHRERR